MIKVFLSTILFCSFVSSSEYDDWLKNQNAEYQSYKKSLDDEFSDMLKKNWEVFDPNVQKKYFKQPKPQIIPTIAKPTSIPKKDLENSKQVVIPKKQEIIEKKVIKTPIKVEQSFQTATFNFYNQPIKLSYDKKLLFSLEKIDENSISQTWKYLSKIDIKSFIAQVEQYNDYYGFNDWAKYLFIYNFGLEIYHNDENKANLLSWFLFVKMGYDTKIAYSRNHLFLLALVKQSLYQVAFFDLDGKKYYVLTPTGKIDSIGAVYTYKGEYPQKLGKLSFDMSQKVININSNISRKKLTFTIDNKPLAIDTQYSKDLVAFYQTFPQSEYQLYFQTKVSANLGDSLLSGLRPLVKNKTEIEAVNLLLLFVQTSFAYKTDDAQFGYEKVLFPEETIYYNYSDCEDRSILFSYLVKNLLGLDVVGLKYKDHLATAVAFSTKISGDGFQFQNKRYTITDPTYVNAKAGMSMPKYKNAQFELIR